MKTRAEITAWWKDYNDHQGRSNIWQRQMTFSETILLLQECGVVVPDESVRKLSDFDREYANLTEELVLSAQYDIVDKLQNQAMHVVMAPKKSQEELDREMAEAERRHMEWLADGPSPQEEGDK